MADIKTKQIQKIIRLAAADTSVDAPDFAIKYARNLFAVRAASAAPGLLRRIIATLTAEISAGVPALGERSAAASSERQLLFQADEVAIDLRIGEGDSPTVRGTILGDLSGAQGVTLVSGGKTWSSTIDELGVFTFSKVPRGDAAIAVTFLDREVAVPSLTI